MSARTDRLACEVWAWRQRNCNPVQPGSDTQRRPNAQAL